MVKPLMDKPPKLDKKTNGRVTLIRDYELLTPLFGGGIKAGVVDETNPIRGTSVRGHLRFWWRATCGGRFEGNLEKMKAVEDAIWGATGNGSQISIAVTESDSGRPYVARTNKGKVVDVGHPSSPLGYVAFPLRESRGKVHEGVSFTLRIDCPKDCEPDLRAALWAWETFGGIGARTRRGFGALHCTDVRLRIDGAEINPENWAWTYSSQTAKYDVIKVLNKFHGFSNLPPIPSLDPDRIHTTPAKSSAEAAWLELIDSLKNFRQSRVGRFGRSHWPEPDAIRHLTGQSLKSRNHNVPIYNDEQPIYKFPRAAFGLPIVFEFKDDDDNNPSNPDKDPGKTELSGAKYERRASRLILRPLKCADGRYVGLATILDDALTIPPGGLALKGSPENPAADAEILTTKEADRIKAKHPRYDGSVDILQAFLNQLPKK